MNKSKLIKKVLNKVCKITKNKLVKYLDLRRETHSIKEQYIGYSYIDINSLDTSMVDREAATYLCGMYLSHTFDLLGSGYVHVTYYMNCKGVEGNIYHGSLNINNLDKDGEWLEKILLKPHLKSAKNIWQHIDNEYIPIDWQMDFKSGFRYSQKKWYLDQPIGDQIGVDIKVPWELARLQHLPQLAVLAIIFPEKREKILREFRNQILDFIMANPPRMGVTWTCTMDVAIRVSNMLIAYDIFSQLDEFNTLDENFNRVFSLSVYEHGSFIVNNLEWYEEFAGNHYLSDISGLLFTAAYLKGDKETAYWLSFSVQEFIAQGLKQFHEDGTNFEASTSYHRLSGEIIVYCTALIYGVLKTDKKSMLISKQKVQDYSDEFFPQALINRIYRAALFTVDITKQNGNIPQVGDNDSGRLFKFSPNGEFLTNTQAIEKYINLNEGTLIESRYFDENILNQDTFVSAANGFFQDEKLYPRDKFNLEKSIVMSLCENRKLKFVNSYNEMSLYNEQIDDLNYLSVVEVKYSDYCSEAIDISDIKFKGYPDFGLYLFKNQNFYLSVMAGGIGQNGMGGHSHNDKLSFELNIKGKDIFIDPGTYLYTPLPEKRNMFRSIRSHNVPIVEDEEQCKFSELFSMKNEIKCVVVSFSFKNVVLYLTYRNIRILREFIINEDKITIIDKCNKSFKENFYQGGVVSNGYGKLTKLEYL